MMTKDEFKEHRRSIEQDYNLERTPIDARHDQRIATLYADTGWTQKRIVEVETGLGNAVSRVYIGRLLKFGRFLGQNVPAGTKVISNMTEWNFRSLWDATDKKFGEPARFKLIIENYDPEDIPVVEIHKKRQAAFGKQIVEAGFGDNKWHYLGEIATTISLPPERVDTILLEMQKGERRVGKTHFRVDRMGDGDSRTTKFRLREIKKGWVYKEIPAKEVKKFIDALEELVTQGVGYTRRHSAKYSPQFALRIFEQIRGHTEDFENYLKGKKTHVPCKPIREIGLA